MENLTLKDYNFNILDYISQITFDDFSDVIEFCKAYGYKVVMHDNNGDLISITDDNITRPFHSVVANGKIYLLSAWQRQAK